MPCPPTSCRWLRAKEEPRDSRVVREPSEETTQFRQPIVTMSNDSVNADGRRLLKTRESDALALHPSAVMVCSLAVGSERLDAQAYTRPGLANIANAGTAMREPKTGGAMLSGRS